jgi:hypothetical protein
MNVGNKVIYGLHTPNTFVNFNKYLYLYFMRLNTFFWEGAHRFHKTLKGVHGPKG